MNDQMKQSAIDFLKDHVVVVPVGNVDVAQVEARIEAMVSAPEPRKLWQIAYEIRKLWRPMYFGAVPYVEAMCGLEGRDSEYGQDSAKSIVTYFLGNATTWRGDDARRIKAELKSIMGIK